MDSLHTQFLPCVTTAFEEILDKMAFMVFEPTGSEGLPHVHFAYLSRIAFKGRLSGSMTLYLTQTTAEEFARNLIGIRNGDDLRRETLEDALREFSNILMGRTLSLLASDEHFDLQLPIAHPATEEGAAFTPTLRLEGMLNEEEPCRIDVVLN